MKGFFMNIAHIRFLLLGREPTRVSIETFRSEYDYEIEYENDFSNLVLMLSIITFHANLVPIVSFSTGQQQGGVRDLRTQLN